MYLSDRDLLYAIQCNKLVFEPLPTHIDATSIDLHLGALKEARVWDIDKFTRNEKKSGRNRPELNIGRYQLGDFGEQYLVAPPPYSEDPSQLVGQRADEVVVKPHGFLLWPTREIVGTNPDKSADLIGFVNAKSTKARAGLIVHLTAPTIHTTWKGHITLEIANLGPFDLVLREEDALAQLTVAKVTSPPQKDVRLDSNTYGQTGVDGRAD